MANSPGLGRMASRRLCGDEVFKANDQQLPFDVHDFWAWSVSDLVSNATRGRLAEYIVARACDIDTGKPRDEWAPVDLITPDGIAIEVKSAAYVQSWYQRQHSRISFSVRPTLTWDPETNRQSATPRREADVYVFALLAHKSQETLDPLNLDQWEFYVLPTSILDFRKRSQHSITLPTLRKLEAGPAGFADIHACVLEALA